MLECLRMFECYIMFELTSIMTGPALPALWSLGRLWTSLSVPTSPPSGARTLASAENKMLGLAQLRHTQLVIPGALVTRGSTVNSREVGRCLRWYKLQTGDTYEQRDTILCSDSVTSWCQSTPQQPSMNWQKESW